MALKLFDYQIVGRDFLAGRKTALLADKQRLGKSAQAISAIDKINARRVLIICRAVARANWRMEFGKFSDKQWKFTTVYEQTDATAAAQLATDTAINHHAIITSYELVDEILRFQPPLSFDVVIVDESHYLKTTDTKRTKSILGKGGICGRTSRIWCLTGTPTPNHAGELWTLLYVFGATSMPYWSFVGRYCTTRETGFGLQITGTNTDAGRIAELQKLMADKVLRRTETDVSIELPKISFSTVMVPPGKVHIAATSFYKWIVPYDKTKEFAEKIEQEMGIVNSILTSGHLSDQMLEMLKAQAKSIATLRKYNALQKLDAACELIRHELEANAYEKVVVFGIHRDAIEGARARLDEYGPVTMYGGSNPLMVERNIKKFQKKGSRCRVFIGNISAAGTSITLDAANHIFFLEESWTPGDNAQAAMRCGGVGQTKPIFVRNFCLDNGVDLRVQEILREKTRQQTILWSALPADLI